jgi:hypothetical protein
MSEHTIETAWAKSSRSMANGDRVEAGVWRKSDRSMGNGACVEVAVVLEPNRG